MRRTLVLFATSLVLWTIVTQLNHELTGMRIYLFVGSLFVTFAALTQRLRVGLTATLLTALVWDATSPVAFGTHVILFTATHAVIFHLRDRVPRDDTVGRVLVALLSNLGLFLVFSFTQIIRSPSPAAVWPRLVVDLVCSQILLALVAPWFFALQTRALTLARVERDHYA